MSLITGQTRRQTIPRQGIRFARVYLHLGSSHWDLDFLLTLGEDLHSISRVEWLCFFADCNSPELLLIPTIQNSEVGSISSWEELWFRKGISTLPQVLKWQMQLGTCKPRAALFSPSAKTKKKVWVFFFSPQQIGLVRPVKILGCVLLNNTSKCSDLNIAVVTYMEFQKTARHANIQYRETVL